MRTKDLWSPVTMEGGYFSGGYGALVSSWGYKTLATATLGDYQGDELYLLRDGNQYGFLVFGYGSCSGCDSLQACDTQKELEALRDSLHDSIVWHSGPDMFRFLKDRDWEGQYYGRDPGMPAFVKASLDALVQDSLGRSVSAY